VAHVRFAVRLRHNSTLPGLQAMAIGGSVARGYADAYSDLEIMFFWAEQPADDMRQSIAGA
jgi:predicted nucleotidyltransferase